MLPRPRRTLQRFRIGRPKSNLEFAALASADRRSENVRIHAVIVAELELRDIERQIFLADLVEGPDHAALDDRPEAFDRVGVDGADNVMAGAVVDHTMRKAEAEPPISGIVVRAEQANPRRNRLPHKFFKGAAGNPIDHAGNYISLPFDRADYWRLASVATSAATAFLIPLAVLVVPADVGFVHLDDATELVDIFHQSRAHLVAHGPRGFVTAESHDALYLKRRDTLFAGQHHVDDAIPVAKRLVGVLEDRSYQDGEPIAVGIALLALPVPLARGEVIDLGIAATRAVDAVGPAPRLKVCPAGIFMRKHGLELRDGQLVDGFRALGFGHGPIPLDGRILP